MKKSFTMIELIFVIVILGILAAVAIPKLAATRDDAEVTKQGNKIETSVSDIASYSISQGKTETNLSKMSNIIKNWEEKGIANNSEENKSKIKIGDDNDCIIIEIISSNDGNDKNVTVKTKGNPISQKCKNLERLIKSQNYNMRIGGQTVAY